MEGEEGEEEREVKDEGQKGGGWTRSGACQKDVRKRRRKWTRQRRRKKKKKRSPEQQRGTLGILLPPFSVLLFCLTPPFALLLFYLLIRHSSVTPEPLHRSLL